MSQTIESRAWKKKLPAWTISTLECPGQRGTAPFGVAKSSSQFTSMLTEAVRQGRPTAYIDSLITAGADVNAQHSVTGLSAMHIAAKFGMCELIEFLADRGAEINSASSSTGATPLYVACYYNQYDAAATLLANGAVCDVSTRNSKTPLHVVAGDGRLPLLHLLAGAGARLDAQAADGMTALHYACRRGKTACAKALIDRDARTDVVNDAGRTPRFEAERAGFTQCAVDVSVASHMQELRQRDVRIPPRTAIDDALVAFNPRPGGI